MQGTERKGNSSKERPGFDGEGSEGTATEQKEGAVGSYMERVKWNGRKECHDYLEGKGW
jgi:hypothetical protein